MEVLRLAEEGGGKELRLGEAGASVGSCVKLLRRGELPPESSVGDPPTTVLSSPICAAVCD